MDTVRSLFNSVQWNTAGILLSSVGFVLSYIILCPGTGRSAEDPEIRIAKYVRKATDIHQICGIFDHEVEDHTVTTEDGYQLTLHRILLRGRGVNLPSAKPVVYLQHGLLTNSELYMCVTNPEKCLPLVLVEHGYDVWLGNNRGNKYSRVHINKSSDSWKFWDFSVDDFARYDIPNSVDYVLSCAKSSKLSYIGFSQGTAQALAALSLNPELNGKMDILVGLAPIMRPVGYASSWINAFIRRNPHILFRLFGRKSMFPSVAVWQTILPIFILHRAMDIALVILLRYYNHNITQTQKLAAYSHIYCSSSVKAVVHWTQIMRNSIFGEYQHDNTTAVSRFGTENIRTPIALIYGDRDSLFDLDPALEHLPTDITTYKLHNYEHIDVLWGQDVHIDVIPRVLELLKARDTQ